MKSQQQSKVKVDEWIAEAEQGDAAAQYGLGYLYWHGIEGVNRDQATALRWFEKAAAQGHQYAKSYLAYESDKEIYKDAPGGGVVSHGGGAAWQAGGNSTIKQISKRADKIKFDKLRAAAEQGDATAQFNYALALDFGNGVEKDTAAAADWYSRAAGKTISQRVSNAV